MNVGKGLSWPLGTPPEFVAYWEDIRRQLYATQEQRDKALAVGEQLMSGAQRLESLLASVARERDEAISDKATLADIWTQQQIRDADEIADLTRERDEARADLAIRQTGALPPVEHLLRENDRLRALLRRLKHSMSMVQWYDLGMEDRALTADVDAALVEGDV